MTPAEIDRLAHMAASIRPAWPLKSLQTGIANFAHSQPHRSYGDTAHALLALALDPATVNPGRLAENGPWWKAAPGHEPERKITMGTDWRACRWHGGHSSDPCPGPEERTPGHREEALAGMRTTLASSRPVDAQGRHEVGAGAGGEVGTP